MSHLRSLPVGETKTLGVWDGIIPTTGKAERNKSTCFWLLNEAGPVNQQELKRGNWAEEEAGGEEVGLRVTLGRITKTGGPAGPKR